jgi:hypothetical protein
MRVRGLRTRTRELDQRVQAAIGELKVLSGLLPICGWCKKIREDRGCWRKIEAYLTSHTDARFAHGICPECTDKMLIEERFGRTTSQKSRSRRAFMTATTHEDVPTVTTMKRGAPASPSEDTR